MLLKVSRPNLIDYINLSKVLDNYMRRRKCSSGESRVGLVCDWNQFHGPKRVRATQVLL